MVATMARNVNSVAHRPRCSADQSKPVFHRPPNVYMSPAYRPSGDVRSKIPTVNVVDAILFQARLAPSNPALCAPGTGLDLVSYGRLTRYIANIGRTLLSLGVRRGQVVAVFADDPLLHAALVLALTRLGAVTFSPRSANLPADFSVDAAVTDVPRPFGPRLRVLLFDPDWLAGDGRPLSTNDIGETSGSDRCRIILTSGTTGEPRGVCFSHDQVLERVLRNYSAFGGVLPNCARLFVDFGLSTSLGFFFLIQMLTRGGMLLFRGSDAGETMQAFGLYSVDGMVASPAGLAEFVGYYEQSPGFPPPFEVIVVGGSLLAPSLARRARARICANLVSAYGATETSMVATAPAHAIAETPGAAGYVLPGVLVEAVDGSGSVLAPGREGRLRVCSAYSVRGYLGDPPGSEDALRDGWFYPGDIGAVTAGGLLVICGREKAIINLGGDKISPERVEAALAACPEVDDVAVFGAANSLGVEEIHVVVVSGRDLDETMLSECCRNELPLANVPLHITRIHVIPRNAAGKIERSRLPDLVRLRDGMV